MKQIVEQLESRNPLQELRIEWVTDRDAIRESVWSKELDDHINDISVDNLSNGEADKRPYAISFVAGLHLWNDNLEDCHEALQDSIIYGVHDTGSYWHGIMHRIEGDFGNTRYWTGKARNHSLFPELQTKISAYLQNEADLDSLPESDTKQALIKVTEQSAWNPLFFIDIVELQTNKEKNPATEEIVKKVQQLEIAILLQYTYEQSGGTGTIVDIA
ncbi:hypothetical protein [Metabacillus fastidiosus]|uniref:hypothetical protein n=1 Tax=Metabacillus fastidiosus TaxID=1458 RepID=UPI003D281093